MYILGILIIIQSSLCDKCINPLFKQDLKTAKKVDSKYCANITDSSCCSQTQLEDISGEYQQKIKNLTNGFNNLKSRYVDKQSQLNKFNQLSNEREFIAFAAAYTSISSGQYYYFDTIKDFKELSYTMPLRELQYNWDQCYNQVILSEAGRECQMCSSSQTSEYIETSLDVCIKLMKECYPYIATRIQLAAYVNVINMLQVLVDNQELTNNLIEEKETYQQQSEFAVKASQVQFDRFNKPNQCNDQFDCQQLYKI